MKCVINKAKNHREAEEWDLSQQTEMTSDERQAIAKILRERFFGTDNVDVRRSRAFRKRRRQYKRKPLFRKMYPSFF